MIKLLLVWTILIPGAAFAEAPPDIVKKTSILERLPYKKANCQLSFGEKVIKEVETDLIPIRVDEHLGRFVQIQFGDQKQHLQYQILIEEDIEIPGNVLVLQTWQVGKYETTNEFSALAVSWLRISGYDYSVKCKVGL